jgi:hypothetical protein
VEPAAWDTLLRDDDGAHAQRLLGWLNAEGARPALVIQATSSLVKQELAPAPLEQLRRDGAGHDDAADGSPAAADVATDSSAAAAADDPLAAQPAADGPDAGAPAAADAPAAAAPAGEGDGEESDSFTEPVAFSVPPSRVSKVVSTLFLAIGPEVQHALADRPEAESIYFSLLTDEPLAVEGGVDVDEYMVRPRSRGHRCARLLRAAPPPPARPRRPHAPAPSAAPSRSRRAPRRRAV